MKSLDTYPNPSTDQTQESDPFQYELLTGHHRTDRSYKTDQQLRMEYIQLTDGLIHKMTEGVEFRNNETGETEIHKPDVVVWLDKSARPLAWLTKELWPTLAEEPETGDVPKMPEFKFVNIDREQWVNKVDADSTGYMDIDQIDSSIIRSLRSIFVPHKGRDAGLSEEIDEADSVLDGKKILIVDEVKTTGRTLDIAKKFFQRAFPTAEIAGAYWMSGIVTTAAGTANRDLPVWYKEKTPYGRGVDNRDDMRSGRSENTTQRLGRWFLSRRFPADQPDTDALKLRSEFKELAKNPDVPVMPSFERADKTTRIEHLNPGKGFQQVVEEMRQIRAQK